MTAKPTRGRPNAGRTKSLPRIGEQYHAILCEVVEFKKCSLAEAIEIVCEVAMDAMEDRPVREIHRRYGPGLLPFARDQLIYRKIKYPQ